MHGENWMFTENNSEHHCVATVFTILSFYIVAYSYSYISILYMNSVICVHKPGWVAYKLKVALTAMLNE